MRSRRSDELGVERAQGPRGIETKDRSALAQASKGGGFLREDSAPETSAHLDRTAHGLGRQAVRQLERPIQDFTGDGRSTGPSLSYGTLRSAGEQLLISAASVPVPGAPGGADGGRGLSAGLGMDRLASGGMIASRTGPVRELARPQHGKSDSADAVSRGVRAAVSAGGHLLRSGFAAIAGGAVSGLFMILGVLLAVIVVITIFLPWLPGVAVDQQERPGQAAGHFSGGAMGDDYPYRGSYSDDAMSPLGYAWGNCTDFVAWRINRDAGVLGPDWRYTWSELTPQGGDGGSWARPGNLEGWQVTTAPVPGDIFSVPAGLAAWGGSGGPYGHVGYIGAVNADGSVVAENYGGGRYFVFTKSAAEVQEAIATGIVFKHNPNNTGASAPAGAGGAETGGAEAAGSGSGRLSVAQAQEYASSQLGAYGWDEGQRQCLIELWTRESSWRWNAQNPDSGAYGIPQALPAEKLAEQGAGWREDARIQIDWGLGYIRDRYGSPCQADAFQRSNNWY